MNNNLNTREQIESRIEDLYEKRNMWAKAGGKAGSNMAIDAINEIHELEVKKADLENGTHNYEILMKEKEIRKLKELKKNAFLFSKINYHKQIKKCNQELTALKK